MGSFVEFYLLIIGGGGIVFLLLRLGYVFGEYFLSGNHRIQVIQASKAKITYNQKRKKIEAIIKQYVPYYISLNTKKRKIFLERVITFMSHKRFVGKEGIQVEMEHKVLISAAAIQLTFGFSLYMLPHFQRIYLFPQKFISPDINKPVLGLADSKGRLVLSYPDVKRGLENALDGFNLALHELAHALHISHDFQKEVDNHFIDYFPRWKLVAAKVRMQQKKMEKPFFRKYALMNMAEMLAVTVEYFFEKSEEFQEKLPDYYYHTAVLLRQFHFHTTEKPTGLEKVHGLYKSSILPKRVVWASPIRVNFTFVASIVLAILSLRAYQSENIGMGVLWTGGLIFSGTIMFHELFFNQCQVLVFDEKIVVQYPKRLWGKYHRVVFFKSLVKAIFTPNSQTNELWYLNKKYLVERVKIKTLGDTNSELIKLFKKKDISVELYTE